MRLKSTILDSLIAKEAVTSKTAGFENHLRNAMEQLGYEHGSWELKTTPRNVLLLTGGADKKQYEELAELLKPDFNANYNGRHKGLVFGAVTPLFSKDLKFAEKKQAQVSNFAVNVKPTMLKLKNNERLSPEEKKHVNQYYLEVVATIPAMKNFAENIKDIMTKVVANKKLTPEENNKIVQFYLESLQHIASKIKLKKQAAEPVNLEKIMATLQKGLPNLVTTLNMSATQAESIFKVRKDQKNAHRAYKKLVFAANLVQESLTLIGKVKLVKEKPPEPAPAPEPKPVPAAPEAKPAPAPIPAAVPQKKKQQPQQSGEQLR